jgi:hypothetical protein
MKNLFLALGLTWLAFPVLQAQDITPAERTKAIKYLEQTRVGVLTATKGLSPAQWDFKPGTNRWSVAEVTEHIAAAEDLLMDLIKNQVLKSPGRTNTEDVAALDELVLKQITDRSHKVQAPEPLKPSNRFGSPQESLKHFQASRARTIAFLEATADLRAHAMDAPMGKKLDGYQWVLLLAAHSERHTKQIIEVKEDPGFPKK